MRRSMLLQAIIGLGFVIPQLLSMECFARSATPAIQGAYRDSAGRLLVEFAPDGERFPAGNTLFMGDAKHLFQIEVTRRESDESTLERNQDFFEPRLPERAGSFRLRPESATLECGKRNHEFRKLEPADLRDLETKLRAGTLPLRFLPDAQLTSYLFKVEDRNEYLLISEPRFNFHGNYRILMGPLGPRHRMREIPVEPVGPPTREKPAGTFRFTSGGGVYVPMAIDLFSDRAANRGSPTLLRTASAPIEKLVRPGISKNLMKKYALDSQPVPTIETPCGAIE